MSAFLPAIAAVVALATAVTWIGLTERDHVRAAEQSTRAAAALLGGIIDSRDALQDFMAGKGIQSVERLAADRVRVSNALATARRLSEKDPMLRRNLDRQARLVIEWNAIQRRVILEATQAHTYKGVSMPEKVVATTVGIIGVAAAVGVLVDRIRSGRRWQEVRP